MRITPLLRNTLYILLVCSTMACQEYTVHRYCAVDSRNWQRKYMGSFCITDIKKKGQYAVSAEVRLDKHYPFQDLWLSVETKKNGEPLSMDTVCLDVLDVRGELGGVGKSIMEYSVPVRNLPLSPDDTLDVNIRHIMSTGFLPGVHDVGVLVTPASEQKKYMNWKMLLGELWDKWI